MSCQRGLRALLHGNRSQLGTGCGLLSRAGTLLRGATCSQKYQQLPLTLGNRNFGEIAMMRKVSCVGGLWDRSEDPQRLPRRVLVVPRRSAGHSKWQNIKHTKEANDMAKGAAFSKIAVKIKLAVQGDKSPDPKLNEELAHWIEEAKRINMPLARIETMVKACKAAKDVPLIPFTMQAKGPGGTFLIIDLLTDNIKRSRGQLKYQLSKLGVTFVDGIMHMFKYKGVIGVDPVPSKLALETAVDVAIEVGAEEVMEATADDGTEVLQFLCEPRDFYKVKSTLADRGYTLKFCKLSYLADQRVSLSDEYLELMSKISDVLDSHPDVDVFFDNVE